MRASFVLFPTCWCVSRTIECLCEYIFYPRMIERLHDLVEEAFKDLAVKGTKVCVGKTVQSCGTVYVEVHLQMLPKDIKGAEDVVFGKFCAAKSATLGDHVQINCYLSSIHFDDGNDDDEQKTKGSDDPNV